jgi:3-dehydrosphinganine reductase
LTGHAIITGGSSGIGLAIAKLLASSGTSVSIIARDRQKLDAAAAAIASVATGGAAIAAYEAHVQDQQACRQAVEAAVGQAGPPGWAIASAGIVHPGTFIDQPLDEHVEQVSTNYLGSLFFAHAVVPHMRAAGGGRIVFLSSGAAFVGLYGYSAYGPTKFAVRGLAESLRVELKPFGISVSLACPGDTNTPQLEQELPRRPAITSKIAGTVAPLSADTVARLIVNRARSGRFLITTGWQLHVLAWAHSAIAPLFRTYQNQVVSGHDKDSQ